MSRLTSRAPFNRPSVLDVLRRPAPLSPPETEMEAGLAQPQDEHNSVSPETQQGSVESPLGRVRRGPNVSYHSSSLSNREPRPTSRQSRWLVMVVPPASLTHEPPLLGHTLSSAPAGRFSNGILMPLFPTLYGQLTAIAREFNMPSTTGVCIYLQLSEPGASMMTPRISDESWQLLWGHFFTGDERTAPYPPHGLPISGRIEFDVDLRRARWFDSWMGHTRRERAGSDVMSREPSVVNSHWRGDSRASLFPTENGGEGSLSPPDADPPATAVSSRTATQRQLPRPLLLDRRDTASVRSFSRHTSRLASVSREFPSPDAPKEDAATTAAEPPFAPKALSPLVLEQEEPQTAKKVELDTLVRQWRESASLPAVPSNALAAAGQPSLDPVNMPAGADVELELDLNDFAWSISSAGPPSESPTSPEWPEHLPSVHLLERLQGSVCLTASTCTSFGPLDYDWPNSPVSCVSRRPSPDLGMRMMDYVPLTPSTATSWGPDDLHSPMYGDYELEYRAPSVDLGVRGMGSRPVTPSTATSWGPADSPLFMPPSPYYVRTPDAGERTFPDLGARWQGTRAPVFPYYSAWETEPWGHVWPYQTHRRQESGLSITLSMPVRRKQSNPLLPEWPDFAALYPADPTVERAAANKSQPVELPGPNVYPFFDLYPTVYPHTLDEIYPTSSMAEASQVRDLHESRPWGHVWPYLAPKYSEDKDVSITRPFAPSAQGKALLSEWPDFAALYPADPKAERAAANKSQHVHLTGPEGYPFLEIYPTAYPYTLDQIYPSRPSLFIQETRKAQSIEASAPLRDAPRKGQLPEWPDFASLYPSDPKVERAAANKSQPVKLPGPAGYPFLELYPTVYPYSLDQIYPATSSGQWLKSVESTASKELLPEWPDFTSLYPSDPKVERAATNKSQPVELSGPVGYPFLELYPVVYPHNLYLIYPLTFSAQRLEALESTAGKELLPERPDFASLYPSDPTVDRAAANKSQPVTLPRPEAYPFLVLYSPVYPHHLEEIYPALHPAPPAQPFSGLAGSLSTSKRRQLLPEYPDFAGLYPSNPQVERVGANKSQPVRLPAGRYPFLQIYSPVYPWNVAEIYGPAGAVETLSDVPREAVKVDNSLSVRLPVYSGYPAFNLYPAPSGFPTFEIYPPVVLLQSPVTTIPSVKLTPAYPAIQLYEPVYPHLVIYPQTQLAVVEELPSRPNSPRNRVPTPGPGRRRVSGSSLSPSTEHQENDQRRRSRSPVQKDLGMPPLPARTAPVMEAPTKHSSTARKPRQMHPDLHRAVFGADSNPTMLVESPQSISLRRKPKRTHHELHLMVFGDLSAEDSQSLDDLVSELPARRPPPPAPVRRSRSGTVSRSSLPPVPPQPAGPRQSLSYSPANGRTRRPSVSTGVETLPSDSSPSPSRLRSSPLAPPPSAPLPPPPGPSPLVGRRRSPSVSGTPPPPGTGLNRVRSMNTPARPGLADSRENIVTPESRGLDRSKSLSDANRTGARQSIVLERAKLFTVSEKHLEASDVLTDFPPPPTARPVSKLDRSKLPFA